MGAHEAPSDLLKRLIYLLNPLVQLLVISCQRSPNFTVWWKVTMLAVAWNLV
ncbi:hypothetical protein [Scytonema millei]|uniref:hypothetical protein n=1 Tax=Scytonema millei TaxID=1245922 RepID=UPI0025724353|nr:hypothetical protein [Scytonema millei]